jgi:hypothetical protein
MSPRDPFDELKQARVSIDPISDETRTAHLLAIGEALASRTVVPLRQRAFTALRWAAAALVILGVLIPTAVVVAADSLPGDLLYPVKRAAEPLLAVFDDEVVARHRIDEVVSLRDQERPSDRALEDATRAVDDLPLDSPLRDQLTDLSATATTTTEPPTARTTTLPSTTLVSDEPTDRTTTSPSTSTTTSTQPSTDRTTTTIAGDTKTDR